MLAALKQDVRTFMTNLICHSIRSHIPCIHGVNSRINVNSFVRGTIISL